MKLYRYKKIDAFTSNDSLGNPAAVLFLEGKDISAGEMQQIAFQHKGFVSEVVFCDKSAVADCKLIYYSSECEVEFCGHGTIATMYDLIGTTSSLYEKKVIMIETGRKGILPVYNCLKEENAVYVTAPDPVYLGLKQVDFSVLPVLLGIDKSRIGIGFPIDFIDAGLRTLIVPVMGLEEEISVFPDELALKAYCLSNKIDLIVIFTPETSDKSNQYHTRVFAPKFGYLEDPATGSGNSAFGYYLIKNDLWSDTSISIEQGGKDRIFNIVRLARKEGKVLFGGSATIRIDGNYYY